MFAQIKMMFAEFSTLFLQSKYLANIHNHFLRIRRKLPHLPHQCCGYAYHFDADPDSTYHPDADPDSDFLFDADPNADPDPDFSP
jgi:hypothetical protein